MKQEFYKQCEFKSGNTKVVAWISEKSAQVGSEVAFKDQPDKWWEVISAGTARITKQQAKKMERRNMKFKQVLNKT